MNAPVEADVPNTDVVVLEPLASGLDPGFAIRSPLGALTAGPVVVALLPFAAGGLPNTGFTTASSFFAGAATGVDSLLPNEKPDTAVGCAVAVGFAAILLPNTNPEDLEASDEAVVLDPNAKGLATTAESLFDVAGDPKAKPAFAGSLVLELPKTKELLVLLLAAVDVPNEKAADLAGSVLLLAPKEKLDVFAAALPKEMGPVEAAESVPP